MVPVEKAYCCWFDGSDADGLPLLLLEAWSHFCCHNAGRRTADIAVHWRIGILGVFFVAVLSGFGSIATPYNYLTILFDPFLGSGWERNEERLQHTISLIFSKAPPRCDAARQKSRKAGWLSRWFSTRRSDESTLMHELQALEALSHELYLEARNEAGAAACGKGVNTAR